MALLFGRSSSILISLVSGWSLRQAFLVSFESNSHSCLSILSLDQKIVSFDSFLDHGHVVGGKRSIGIGDGGRVSEKELMPDANKKDYESTRISFFR